MPRRYRYLIAMLLVGYWVGCSPVKFEKDVTNQCTGSEGCIYNPTSKDRDFDLTKIISAGTVDILIVDDNSGSMSFEQNNMADRFVNFVSTLDSRSLDYRIGITTTDISASPNNNPRAINGNGALQDGKLIQIASGINFISNSTQPINVGGVWKNKEALFADAIKRTETLTCESFLAANGNAGQTSTSYMNNCPSADERGIYAANLFVKQNPSSFIRPNAHLAIVFLSDEDVRSSLYQTLPNYSLTDLDLPQTLINNIKSTYGGKGFSIHSLIVRPGALTGGTAEDVATAIAGGAAPSSLFDVGDSGCLNLQGNQTTGVSGSYGYLYALATRMTQGIEGNICSSNYTLELQNIGKDIADRVDDFSVACVNPKNLQVFMNGASYTQYTLNGTTIKFNQSLPTGSLRVKYSCPPL